MGKQTKQNILRIGIRELKNKASQILKRVRKKNEIIANRKKVLLTIDELAVQISAKWNTSTKESSVDAVRKIRR